MTTSDETAKSQRPPKPPTEPRVLVVDDTELNRKLLGAVFTAARFEVITAEHGEAALARIVAAPPSVVILDLNMPGMDGIETLRRIKQIAPELPVIMLTSHGEIAAAVEATRLGAYDFLTRPIHNDQVVLAVRRAIEHRRLLGEVHALRCQLTGGDVLARLDGPSDAMRAVARQIRQAAPSNVTVLIQGETGTGKELVARAIHQQSERASGPFIALDCGALPETLLESELFGYEKGAFSGATQRKPGQLQLAEGGTLFLDETANLSSATQAKLLRVLQERQVQPLGATRAYPLDLRVIAATNDTLEEQVNAGKFRRDLFFRLAEFTIRVPPLRERQGDVVALAERFLVEACSEFKRPQGAFSEGALSLLRRHAWTGNVRELRNAVRQAVLRADDPTLTAEDIEFALVSSPGSAGLGPAPTPAASSSLAPSSASSFPPPGASVLVPGRSLKDIAEGAAEQAERLAIAEALQQTRQNKTQAAKLLQVDYKTLYNKLKRYGLSGRDDP